MAQVVKLKRTAVEGKVPTTATLELGELAINTYDGKIFFEKDNGTPSIQQIVTTDTQTTGSINLTGAITASYFKGDGSQIINLPAADVSQVATVTSSFDNQSSISVTHNFNTKNVLVSVYGTNDSQIIPSSVTLTNNNTATIELSAPESGYAVVAKGGHIVSGTLLQEITQVATVTSSFDVQSTISVSHNFNTDNVIISVYDSNKSQIIPSSVVLTDSNTATIGLSAPQSGYVVVAKGGHLVIGTAIGATTGSNTFKGNQTITGSLLVSGSTTQIGNNNLYGNTFLYGTIDVSGSTNFHNHTITMTGSMYTSGSQSITGSLDVKGNINVASGSEFYLAGNKLFNYGQFSDTTTQSGSANTAYSMKLNTTDFAHEVSIVSGSRIQPANTGIYNLQFSAQLSNTANTEIDFDIWLAYTGSNISNSNTQVSLTKTAGSKGKLVAAWNWMIPIKGNDYVEIKWNCTDSTGQIFSLGAQTNPTRPAIPSVIATLTQIG